jgi:hypothetical protein
VRFSATNLLDRGGEDLHDMESVHDDGGTREVLGGSGEKGGGHVAEDLGDAGRFTAVLQQEGTESFHSVLALAGGNEEYRSAASRSMNTMT